MPKLMLQIMDIILYLNIKLNHLVIQILNTKKRLPTLHLQLQLYQLFYSQKRPQGGWNSNTLCQFFHHLFRNVGIDGASSHSPRRTAITNLADKGVSVRVLQSIARHANISTTQCYIDVNDAMKRKAIELI